MSNLSNAVNAAFSAGFSWKADPAAKRARLVITPPKEGWDQFGSTFVSEDRRRVVIPQPGVRPPILLEIGQADPLWIALTMAHGVRQSITDAGALPAGTAEEEKTSAMDKRAEKILSMAPTEWAGGAREIRETDELAPFVRGILTAKLRDTKFMAALKAKGIKVPALTGGAGVQLAAYRKAAEGVVGRATPDGTWQGFVDRVRAQAEEMREAAQAAIGGEDLDPFGA